MAKFSPGDKVQVLDDNMEGIVVKVAKDRVVMETSEGFVLEFEPSELIAVGGKGPLSVSSFQVAQIKQEKELSGKRRSQRVRPKERSAPQMEVDLHIQQLVPNFKGMGNYDMLNLQLETAKRQLEFAIQKKIQKVVFIHGVGEGVLKEELHYLFGRYDRVRYYDADYQKYGLGATEVYIEQS